MTRVRRRTLALLSSAPLVMLAGTQPAWAHGKAPVAAQPIQGTVTGVGSSNLQVQTPTGSVQVTLTDETRILRLVHGSTADLHTSQHVELHFLPGGTVVDAIQIDAAPAPKSTHDHKPGGSKPPEPKHTSPHPPTSHPPSGRTTPPTTDSGDIASVSDHVISVREAHGKSFTFSLSANISVTKLVAGTPGDLAIGETVRVLRGHAGTSLVTIVDA